MEAKIVIAKTSNGSTLWLVKQAIEQASIGKKVLFVTTEMTVRTICGRLYSCMCESHNIEQMNIDQMNITIRKANNLNFVEPGEYFDVVVIDSPNILFYKEQTFSIPFEKLDEVIGDALLITNLQATRNGFENGRVQVSGCNVFPECVKSATYLEKVDENFVETSIDLKTFTKRDVVNIFKIGKKTDVSLPYFEEV